ncbi:MAG: hypothetical protein IJL26_07695 [Clostridia bacterium]|nr:hypothetical protein [Clostridia bacterium]
MKKNVTRALAVLTLLSLVLSMAACVNANTATDNILTVSLVYTDDGAETPANNDTPADAATNNDATAPIAAPAANSDTTAPTAAPAANNDTTAPTAAPAASSDTTAPTAAPAANDDTPAASETPSEAPAQNSDMPQGTQAIYEFYKKSVDDIKQNGAAGYLKKSYQTIGDLNVTGIGAVDNFIKGEASKRMRPESDPWIDDDAKGSDEAKRDMTPCELTDLSKIVSATCVDNGGNYDIKLVFADEDTPQNAESSFLAKVTNNVMFKEDIDKELEGLASAIKDPVYHVIYKGTMIEATMTPTGQFITLHHYTNVDIQVDSVKILVFPLNNKGISMSADIWYTEFKY